jgi:hypothetical protein
MVEAGLLMSYGTVLVDMFRQSASIPAPSLRPPNQRTFLFLQSTKFEFVLNLQTARSLDLDIPPSCSPAPTKSSNNVLLAALHESGDGTSRK